MKIKIEQGLSKQVQPTKLEKLKQLAKANTACKGYDFTRFCVVVDNIYTGFYVNEKLTKEGYKLPLDKTFVLVMCKNVPFFNTYNCLPDDINVLLEEK